LYPAMQRMDSISCTNDAKAARQRDVGGFSSPIMAMKSRGYLPSAPKTQTGRIKQKEGQGRGQGQGNRRKGGRKRRTINAYWLTVASSLTARRESLSSATRLTAAGALPVTQKGWHRTTEGTGQQREVTDIECPVTLCFIEEQP
jgi:hypothetical protein